MCKILNMAICAILVSFFTTDAHAVRIAQQSTEHERHTDAHASDLVPGHPFVELLAQNVHGVGSISRFSLSGGVGRPLLLHGRSPAMLMQDPGYLPGLPDDWKS